MSPYRNASLITILLAASALAGFFAYRHLLDGRSAAFAPAPPTAIPTVRPEFELPDPDGTLRSSREWAGEALVINFWATWCKPCRKEVPLLIELQQRYAPAGIRVVGVALDFADAVASFAAEMRINYPLLVGEQAAVDLATAFGIEFPALPFTVFTAGDGTIIGQKLGELHRAEAELYFATLGRIESGELEPPAARRLIETQLATR